MKNKFENFKAMDSQELVEINGGGFAYDVGRVLRLLCHVGGGNAGITAMAISEWQVNAMINNL
jgi:hypothetical protein